MKDSGRDDVSRQFTSPLANTDLSMHFLVRKPDGDSLQSAGNTNSDTGGRNLEKGDIRPGRTECEIYGWQNDYPIQAERLNEEAGRPLDGVFSEFEGMQPPEKATKGGAEMIDLVDPSVPIVESAGLV